MNDAYVGEEKSWEECMIEVLVYICPIIILSNTIFVYGTECGWDSSDDCCACRFGHDIAILWP